MLIGPPDLATGRRDSVSAVGFGWPYGLDRADLIDTLTMYSDVRRQVVRLLAEIEAAG